MASPRILYCHCAHTQVVPKEVKDVVLRRLCESGVAFDAVADLCELSARQDASLKTLAAEGQLKIAACYPRAVKWLFAAGRAPLNLETTEVLNMRAENADTITTGLLRTELQANLPAGKVSSLDSPKASANDSPPS